VVLSLLFEICRLYGGFFASPTVVQDYPAWKFADVLSYIKYCFIGVALNELSQLELSCPPSEYPNGCSTTSGQQTIIANSYDDYSMGFCIGILFVLIIGARLLAYIGLRFVKA
jgi:ATP-binding cassette subfamily G (WHITE) protein 2